MNNTMDFFKPKDNFKKYHHIKSKLIMEGEWIEKPFISIVIPTYKKHEMFKIALNSTLHFIGNYEYEIVVVNDDPEDIELEQYIKTLDAGNLNYYRNERNLGLFGNWNRCFELARGDWVAILNDDDYLYSFYLDEVIKVLKQHQEIQYLYVAHDTIKIGTPQQAHNIFSKKEIQAFKRNIISHNNVMKKRPLLSVVCLLDYFMTQSLTHPLGTLIRREKMLEIGGYNEEYYPSSDWIFNVNYLMNYNMYFYNQSLGCRSEGINLSNSIQTRRKFIEVDYLFRNEMAKYIRLPFKKWYTDCLLNNYARRMGVQNIIKIKPIKKRSSYELMVYRNLRQNYIRLRNLTTTIKYNKNIKKKEVS